MTNPAPPPTKSDDRSAQPIKGLSKRAQAMVSPKVWGRINTGKKEPVVVENVLSFIDKAAALKANLEDPLALGRYA